MKSIFASLIVALLAVSATAKDRVRRYCIFPVHAESNPNDTATFDWRLIGETKKR